MLFRSDEFHDARSRNERGALIAGLEKHLKNDSGALPKESGNPANELEMETPQQETSGEKIHLNSREALALALISDLAQKKSCGTSDIDVAIRALERAFKGWQFSFGANSENAIDLSGGFYAIQGEVEGPERAISVFKYFEKSFQRLQERVRKSGNWKDVA